MQPEGSGPVNPTYFTELTAQINAIQGTGACAELQSVVNAAAASIQAELTAIRAQITALTPIITLPSANPGSILTWITNFTAPYVAALAKFEAQLADVLASIAALESAIVGAAERLLTCTISIPPMT
jgi:hypothetical protein